MSKRTKALLHKKEQTKRLCAQLSGWSLLLMALIAGISLGYAFETVKGSLMQGNFGDYKGLYYLALGGISLIILLDLIVSYTLYAFFKSDNQQLAIASGALRLIYTLIFIMAASSLFKNLSICAQNRHDLGQNISRFEWLWTFGLIIFGLHLFVTGVLMKLHRRIPSLLWICMLLAGVSYTLLHMLKIAGPAYEKQAELLQKILMLPMILGEMGLAVWLLLKGGKKKSSSKVLA